MLSESKQKNRPEGDFLIRDYHPGDYPEVSRLWELTGMGDPRRGDDAETIELSLRIGGRLLILEHLPAGKIAGTSWMSFDGRRLHLHHFGIHPDYQGQGLSHLLARASIAYAREKKIQIKLEVHRENRKATELYLKHGFSYLGDYNIYIIRDP